MSRSANEDIARPRPGMLEYAKGKRLLYKRQLFAVGYLARARLKRYRQDIVIGTRERPVTIMFDPDKPNFTYTIWKLARLARLKIVPCAAGMADIVVCFSDRTTVVNDSGHAASWYRLNAACTDIGKDHVARIFAEVFGYDLSIDPLTWQGRAVAKSICNFRHDGRIIDCPVERIDPEMAYQKLIDTAEDGRVVDLRTSIVGTRIPNVMLMTRPAATRFANMVATVTPIATEKAFSAAEQALILQFCRRLGLDLGELDILRDRADGRLYIVDANKTSASPSIKPDFDTGFQALMRMSRAFKAEFGRPPEGEVREV